MPSLGLLEIAVIGIILLLAVGPQNLPHTVRWMGRTYGQLRRAAEELRRQLVLEADRLDEEERLKDLRSRRQEAEARRRAEAEALANPDGPVAQPEPHAPPPVDDAPPEGFTEEEWAEMPEDMRAVIRRRQEGA